MIYLTSSLMGISVKCQMKRFLPHPELLLAIGDNVSFIADEKQLTSAQHSKNWDREFQVEMMRFPDFKLRLECVVYLGGVAW